jgi:Tol biopolymer transport system component
VFFSGGDGTLKRIPLAGGSPHTLCATENPHGIDWSEGGIVFVQPDVGIMRVSATGGKPELIVPIEPGKRAHMPQVLAGDVVLYSVAQGLDSERWDMAQVMAHSLRTGETKTLLEGGSAARYLSSGHLIYAVGYTYFARTFDLATLEVGGAPTPVLEGVARSSSTQSGGAHIAISASGTLAYVPGNAGGDERRWELVVAERSGALTALNLPPGAYDAPRLSRDGTRVTFQSTDGRQYMVLVYDLSGAAAVRRVTLDGNNRFPIWTADGTRVTFQSDREGDAGIFWQAADGATPAERLTRPAEGESHIPESWSPDGQTLLIDVLNSQRHALWTLSLADRKLRPFVEGGRVPMRGSFHPDGKWIVYVQPKDGELAVQVQPFPATGAKFELLRTEDSVPHDPVWSPDGRALYYVAGPGLLWTVPIVTAPGFAFGNATSFPRKFSTAGPSIRGQYDVTPDGRFIASIRSRPAAETPATPGTPVVRPNQQIRIVVNWMEKLKAMVRAR